MSSYRELMEKKKNLDEQIAKVRKVEAATALAAIRAQIAEFGFTAQEVFPWQEPKKKAPAKYYDAQTGATWSGKGKPPRWIQGKDREAFLIQA